jgi:hypothetical protein
MTEDRKIRPLTRIELEKVDIGVRRLVGILRRAGFDTGASSDGEARSGGMRPFILINLPSGEQNDKGEAKRLLRELEHHCGRLTGGAVTYTYNPFDERSTLRVENIRDSNLIDQGSAELLAKYEMLERKNAELERKLANVREKMIGTTAAAKIFGVSSETIRRLCIAGLVECILTGRDTRPIRRLDRREEAFFNRLVGRAFLEVAGVEQWTGMDGFRYVDVLGVAPNEDASMRGMLVGPIEARDVRDLRVVGTQLALQLGWSRC